MLKKLFIVFLIIVFLISGGCNNNNNSNNYYTFTDSEGYKVVLEEKPNNVAILFSSFVEVWKLAGGEVNITVGESIERGFSNEAILVDDKAGKTINIELLISSEPDFVICSSDIAAQVDAANILRDVGIPCALMRIESFDDYLNLLNLCTDILETKEKYETNGRIIQKNIENILQEIDKELLKNKKILFIRAASSAKSTKAKGTKDHFVCEMLNEIGVKNIADESKILLDGLNIEEILLQNPDYIFISLMGDYNTSKEYVDSLIKSEIWMSLDAIKNNKYYYLPKELFHYKPNVKWDVAYRYLVEIIYEEN